MPDEGAQQQMNWPFATPPVGPEGGQAPPTQPAADPPVTQQPQNTQDPSVLPQASSPPPMPTARLRTKGYDIPIPQPFRAEDFAQNPWASHLAAAASSHLNQLLLDEAKKIAQPVIERAAQASEPLSNDQLRAHVWELLAQFDFRLRRKRQAKPQDPVEAKMRELAQERVVRYLIDVRRVASSVSELRQHYDLPSSVDLYLHKHPELRAEAEQIVRAQQAPADLGFEPVAKA